MTEYKIGDEINDRKEAIKACIDGAFLESTGGPVFQYIDGGFYQWVIDHEYWSCWHVINKVLDNGPWTIVEDPSKPKPKKYSEMTPEVRRLREERLFVHQADHDELVMLRTEIEALRNPWQPIETAPKDGTDFITYVPNFCGEIFTVYGDEFGIYTHDRGVEFYFELEEDYWPTHWMPLPQPPKSDMGIPISAESEVG